MTKFQYSETSYFLMPKIWKYFLIKVDVLTFRRLSCRRAFQEVGRNLWFRAQLLGRGVPGRERCACTDRSHQDRPHHHHLKKYQKVTEIWIIFKPHAVGKLKLMQRSQSWLKIDYKNSNMPFLQCEFSKIFWNFFTMT